MKKRLFFLVIVIINSVTNISAIQNYFPLQVGNYWEYNNNYKYQIFSDSIINGQKYFKYGISEDSPEYYFRYDNSGKIYAYSFILSDEYLWFDFNLSLVDTCIYNNGYDTYYAEILEDSVTVETEAGIFNNCKLVIFYIPDEVDSDKWYYFAPEIGIVKMFGAWLPLMTLKNYEIDNSTTIDNSTIAINENNLNCYPNPFKNRINISVDIENTMNCNIDIFNQNGQLIKKIYNGNLGIGKHEFIWNSIDLKPDIYFVELNKDEKRISKKIVMLK